MNETQNEVRFTNNPTIYLEVAVVKLANQRRLPASGEVSVSNQEVQQLRQEIQKLQSEVRKLQENPSAASSEPVNPPAKKTKNSSTFRVPKERVFQVLKEATKRSRKCAEHLG